MFASCKNTSLTTVRALVCIESNYVLYYIYTPFPFSVKVMVQEFNPFGWLMTDLLLLEII